MGLVARFESFIRTMRGFEDIDALLGASDSGGKKHADYLVGSRTVIIEQKALIADPAEKPQKFMDNLSAQGRIFVYGKTSTDAIFRGLPDGPDLKSKMFLAMTKGLEDGIAYADKQTRDTRESFDIPRATGVVVLLNESALSLRPELILYGLHHVFNRKYKDGSFRYRNNDGVILISGAHPMSGLMGCGMPCFSAVSPQPRSEAVFWEFSNELLDAWAAFNGVPRVRYTIETRSG